MAVLKGSSDRSQVVSQGKVSCEEVNRWERREDGEFGVETKAAFVRHSRVL